MPELPEVETIRRRLAPRLSGRTFSSVVVEESRLRIPVDLKSLQSATHRAPVLGLRRRSKYLLIDLAKNSTLVVHLGMSGQLRLVDAAEPLWKHDHIRLRLGRDQELRYHDPRRFGLVIARPTLTLDADPLLARLGPEPLSPGCDGAYLFQKSRGSRREAKTFLMDAHVIVGVGNIYANEALHRAGIHPRRQSGRIARPRWERLFEHLREILNDAIEAGGTTLNDYRDPDGARGDNQSALRVYGCEGRPCLQCAAPIRRVVQQNRATYYCPHCQR